MKSSDGFANKCINTLVQKNKNSTFCHGLNQEQSSCLQLKKKLDLRRQYYTIYNRQAAIKSSSGL